eukprot:Opistho-2@84939
MASSGVADDPSLWTKENVLEWVRASLSTDPPVAEEVINKTVDAFSSNEVDGASLGRIPSVGPSIWTELIQPAGIRHRLMTAWSAKISATGLDKGKKREASQSDDDAADSTTRDASKVRKRARTVDVDDNNNESVERRKRPRPPIHSASDVPEKIRALREAIGKAALTEDILK